MQVTLTAVLSEA